MKYWSKVNTPFGIGYVSGKNSELIEVSFTKKDYVGKDGDLTEWNKVTKYGGPCCFKWFKHEEISIC